MPRRDPPQVLLRRVRADSMEERPDLPGPLLQVRAEERQLLLVGELRGGELLGPGALPKPALAARPQVAHPLRVAARRHDVAPALEVERIHRSAPPLAALAPAHLQDASAGGTDADPGQPRDDRVEDVLGEPPGTLVVGGHRSPYCAGSDSARALRKPSRQLGQVGRQPSSRLALAFEAPRTSVINTTAPSPASIRPTHT